MEISALGGAWGAVSFAATGVAILGLSACVALIRDMSRMRQRKHDILVSYNEIDARLGAAMAANTAIRMTLANVGVLHVRLGAAGVILESNAAFKALRASSGAGDAVHFDLASVGAGTGGDCRKIREGEVECRMADRTILWSLATVRAADGASVIEATGRDITADRRQEEGDAAKSRFLATVSHEMRTPLNGVLGMAGLLRDTGLTPEQASYVDAVQTSGEALLSLINEILDYSRIAAGKLETVSEPVEIEPLVEGLVELLSPRAQDKGIEIAAFVHPDVPAAVMGDSARLRQVLMNLAGNAVKFTEKGGVGIRVEAPEGGSLVISVADTGPGIAADRLDAIFHEFEQADADTASRHGGSGLGLAISRRIVEHLGGAVSVSSRVGSGSVFTVSLPLLAVAGREAPPRPAPAGDLAGEHVAIVSASPFEAPFLAERLERLGAATRLFSSGDAVKSALADSTIVLVDAGLGMDVCREMAEVAAAAGVKRRIILLSPYERRGFGSPSEAGYDGYLIKPVRSRSLAARFIEPADLPEGGTSAAPVVALEPLLAGRRVLIAEDNPINALLACRLVERMGGVAVWAKDGAEAVALLSQAGAAPFALALFDVRMPRMTGLEAVAALRLFEAETGAGRLPVIALTANAFADDRRDCLAAGFDAFLPKPMDRQQLAGVLSGLLGRQRKAA